MAVSATRVAALRCGGPAPRRRDARMGPAIAAAERGRARPPHVARRRAYLPRAASSALAFSSAARFSLRGSEDANRHNQARRGGAAREDRGAGKDGSQRRRPPATLPALVGPLHRDLGVRAEALHLRAHGHELGRRGLLGDGQHRARELRRRLALGRRGVLGCAGERRTGEGMSAGRGARRPRGAARAARRGRPNTTASIPPPRARPAPARAPARPASPLGFLAFFGNTMRLERYSLRRWTLRSNPSADRFLRR